MVSFNFIGRDVPAPRNINFSFISFGPKILINFFLEIIFFLINNNMKQVNKTKNK